MKKYFFSQIEWLDFSEGGRKVIPAEGARYGPLIELDDYELESESRWSVVFICPNFDETNSITLSMYYFVITLPIDEKTLLSLETKDAENGSENAHNIPKSFMRKYKEDLTEISDLYKKLLGYIGPYLSLNNNKTRNLKFRNLSIPEKTAEYEKYEEELDAFKDRKFTEDEIEIMCNFLNKLNKEDNIVEAYPRLVEEYPDLEKELLIIASTCLDGGFDLFNEYYSRTTKKRK